MTKSQTQILKFIKEIDQMKSIIRLIHIDGGKRNEDNAQHSWHISLMVWLFAKEFEKKINIEKAIKMALIHDLVEIYAGDVSSFDVEGRKTKQQREQKAAQKLFKLLPEAYQTEMHSLWNEYEEKKTPEAFFVQAIDKLQPIMQNLLVSGKSWQTEKITEEMLKENKSRYNDGSDFLTDLFNNLLAEGKRKKYFYEDKKVINTKSPKKNI